MSMLVCTDRPGAAGNRGDGTGGERELGFVTAIAYTGFLAGPPIIGGIAQASNYGVAFVFVAVTAALILPAALAAERSRRREETMASAGRQLAAPRNPRR